jgi:hypothetical protein
MTDIKSDYVDPVERKRLIDAIVGADPIHGRGPGFLVAAIIQQAMKDMVSAEQRDHRVEALAWLLEHGDSYAQRIGLEPGVVSGVAQEVASPGLLVEARSLLRDVSAGRKALGVELWAGNVGLRIRELSHYYPADQVWSAERIMADMQRRRIPRSGRRYIVADEDVMALRQAFANWRAS